MVQSINTKALLTLASVVRRPSLLVPHVSVSNVSEINYQALKDHCHVRAVIFDKDNTLTAPYALEIHEHAKQGLQSAISVFGIENVAILSNSAGTADDVEYKDANQIETELGIAVIKHNEKKPGGLNEVLQHFTPNHNDNQETLQDNNNKNVENNDSSSSLLDPSQLCMIGDRLLTDVVFGNLYGMLSIHTLPLCDGDENVNDNKIASVIRKVENKSLYGNWFGGRYLQTKMPSHKYWPGPETCSLRLPSSNEDNGKIKGDSNDNDDEEEEAATTTTDSKKTTTVKSNGNI